MKKHNPQNNVPLVLEFKARLFRHPNAAKAGGSGTLLLDVPDVVSKKAHSSGMTTVEGTINGHPFRGALEPSIAGGHWLPVNKAMREGAGADAGDTVQLAILEPAPEPAMPVDLRVALSASNKATTLWKDLTPIGRTDWIRWVESAKQPETRTRRITRTVEQLSEGKRRPCCVNVYEFMMRHIPTNVNRREKQ
ncbi:MAG: YdeI/OmpD-associated family protein [Alphaproteobacteria bacterium]